MLGIKCFQGFVMVLLVVIGQGCSNGNLASSTVCDGIGAPLFASEVNTIMLQAAASLDSTTMTVAVVDRAGNILGLFFAKPGADPANDDFGRFPACTRRELFSATTRPHFPRARVRFISGIHFPPGVSFTPSAALYGIENTNRGLRIERDF